MRSPVTTAIIAGIAALWACLAPQPISAAEVSAKAAPPADRVVVMYFHRTQRCPTCLKMGSYSEEAVTTRFAPELKTGKVEFHYIDFQDEKNAPLTEGYHVGGPSLVVAKVVGNKVAEHMSLAEIWTKVRDKAAFFQYVEESVKAYQK
jgi:hypothetical protein